MDMSEETRLMLEIAKMRILRKGEGKMMNSLQLRQSLRLELKKLEHYKDCKSLQDMFSSEQYISKAKKYCDLLHEFDSSMFLTVWNLTVTIP